jgi:hypothetical protein
MSSRTRTAVLLFVVTWACTPAVAAAQAKAEGEASEGERPVRGDFPGLGLPIKLSGYFWTDTGYMQRTNAQPGQYDQDASYMQGRLVLRGTFEKTFKGHFAMARLELAGLVNEFVGGQYAAPHILDSYVKVGEKRWDVQLGRFLAWEIYYRGQGIELYTAEEAGALGAPPLYWLEVTRGHMNGPGQAAVHYFPIDFLALEVAGVYGQESGQNYLGVRPAADLTFRGLRLVAGYEYLDQSPQISADKVEVTSQGYAARLQYSLAPAGSRWIRAPAGTTFSEEAGKGWIGRVAVFGVEVAHTSVDATRIDGEVDAEKTLDKTTVGGFVDVDFWRNSIGVGYHWTEQENEQGEKNTHQQAFVSYLYRLPIEGLSVKAVYGFARADIEDVDVGGLSTWSNEMSSVRVRVRYDFL